MRIALTLAVVALVGCGGGGDSTAPLERGQMARGRYSYEVPRLDAKYKGTLTITYSTPDSIAGAWAVPAYKAKAERGHWYRDTYVLYGMEVGSTENAYQHNVNRTGDSYYCSVFFVSSVFPCTLVYLGP